MFSLPIMIVDISIVNIYNFRVGQRTEFENKSPRLIAKYFIAGIKKELNISWLIGYT